MKVPLHRFQLCALPTVGRVTECSFDTPRFPNSLPRSKSPHVRGRRTAYSLSSIVGLFSVAADCRSSTLLFGPLFECDDVRNGLRVNAALLRVFLAVLAWSARVQSLEISNPFVEIFGLCGRSAAISSAAHRRSSTLILWCTFERGGVRNELRASAAQLLVSPFLHIPSRVGLVALRQ